MYMYLLSESLLCHSTAVEVCLCLVLYCVGGLNPVPAEVCTLVARLVEHSCLESGEPWVQIPPRAALFSFKKGLLWVCSIVCLCLAHNLVDDTCSVNPLLTLARSCEGYYTQCVCVCVCVSVCARASLSVCLLGCPPFFSKTMAALNFKHGYML